MAWYKIGYYSKETDNCYDIGLAYGTVDTVPHTVDCQALEEGFCHKQIKKFVHLAWAALLLLKGEIAVYFGAIMNTTSYNKR